MRVIVACINWSHEDSPKAMSYALRDDEAVATAYHDTWEQAMNVSDISPGCFTKRGWRDV